MEKEYETIIDTFSSKPFHVRTGNGDKKIWYYLSHGLNKGVIHSHIDKIHKCMTCKTNICKIGGMFGPNDYALSFKDKCAPFYNVEQCREEDKANRGIDPYSTFLVTMKNVENICPRIQGKDKNGNDYVHLSLNVSNDYIIDSSICNTITKELCCKFWNGTMDKRLEEIITSLQYETDDCISDMQMFDTVLRSEKLLRKQFWHYRIQYAKAVQKYSRRFPNGKTWRNMTHIDRMHVRVFSLFYGGSYSYSENLAFKAVGQLIDCSTDVYNGGTLVSFMNSRSDPESYMVMQVSRAVHTHSILARFTVSLAWQSMSDLDLWVRTSKGEKISHSSTKSKDGHTYINFDANAHEADSSMSPVESITLSDKYPDSYDIYVNNFQSRRGDKIIPFTIVVNIDGELETHDHVWKTTPKRKPGNNNLKKMIYVTTVTISDDMIRKMKAPEMSTKQSNRFHGLLDGFTKLFGNIRTKVIDMKKINNVIHLNNIKEDKIVQRNLRDMRGCRRGHTLLSLMNTAILPIPEVKRRTSISERTGAGGSKTYKTIDDIIKGIQEGRTMRIHVRSGDFSPTVLTEHSCPHVLKTNVIASTYYKSGNPPVQPNENIKFEFCKIDRSWVSTSPRLNIMNILRMESSNYDGHFLGVEKGHLPRIGDCVSGAGMYPTDLKSEYHKFRDMWVSHHTSVMIEDNPSPSAAIGIFIHKNRSTRMWINGLEMIIN